MPMMTPLFQYADGRSPDVLRDLAKNIRKYGVLYNDSFGVTTCVEPNDEEKIDKALFEVEKAIKEWHKHAAFGDQDETPPWEERHPDFEKDFREDSPNMFFILVDEDLKYIPATTESNSSAQGFSPRHASHSLIVALLIHSEFIKRNDIGDLQSKRSEKMTPLTNNLQRMLDQQELEGFDRRTLADLIKEALKWHKRKG
mgnify:CR=1 FL=1|jgi:hypothetical protein